LSVYRGILVRRIYIWHTGVLRDILVGRIYKGILAYQHTSILEEYKRTRPN
jgi:hypothetical protein